MIRIAYSMFTIDTNVSAFLSLFIYLFIVFVCLFVFFLNLANTRFFFLNLADTRLITFSRVQPLECVPVFSPDLSHTFH